MTPKRTLLTGASFLLAITAGVLFYSVFFSEAEMPLAVSTARPADEPPGTVARAAPKAADPATFQSSLPSPFVE